MDAALRAVSCRIKGSCEGDLRNRCSRVVEVAPPAAAELRQRNAEIVDAGLGGISARQTDREVDTKQGRAAGSGLGE